MTFKEKCALVRIHSALDEALGDTDPDCQGMTRREIREEEPAFWACQQIAKLIGRPPWNKYCIDIARALDNAGSTNKDELS
jgi:hypothetical protein